MLHRHCKFEWFCSACMFWSFLTAVNETDSCILSATIVGSLLGLLPAKKILIDLFLKIMIKSN